MLELSKKKEENIQNSGKRGHPPSEANQISKKMHLNVHENSKDEETKKILEESVHGIKAITKECAKIGGKLIIPVFFVKYRKAIQSEI